MNDNFEDDESKAWAALLALKLALDEVPTSSNEMYFAIHRHLIGPTQNIASSASDMRIDQGERTIGSISQLVAMNANSATVVERITTYIIYSGQLVRMV